MTRNWTIDWESFVRSVGDLFNQGLDNRTVTEQFAGTPVVWTGRVAEKRFDTDRPGVQMEMQPIEVKLPGGRVAIVDYLFLTLNDGDMPLWNDVKVGTPLRFTTRIRKASGPFTGVSWSDLDERRGVVLFLTEGAAPLNEQ